MRKPQLASALAPGPRWGMVTLPSLDDIETARGRLADMVIRSPLIRYTGPVANGAEIYLKLECLQPYGSFKIRAGANALRALPPERLEPGIATASAGNFAQGLTAAAAMLGAKVTVYAPETAARKKLDALADLGAAVELMPFTEWWSIMENHGRPGDRATFIHPVANTDVMAGNGTIGLEIVDDLPDVDAVLIPFGGGGLLAGIGAAVRAKGSQARLIGCESAAATPLAAALTAGRPVTVDFDTATFINGIGSTGVLAEMWPLLCDIADDAATTSIDATRKALRNLALRHGLVCEGAGAVALAVALSGRAGQGKLVCVVSGSNIDPGVFCDILTGGSERPGSERP